MERGSVFFVADRRRFCVLVLADVDTPGDDVAVLVCLLDCDVRHEPGRCGAVPVVLTRLEEDTVPGPDHLDRATLTLAKADTFGDPDRLPMRMRVPGSARAGREVDARCSDARAAGGRCDRVDEDRSGEPVLRPAAGFDVVPRNLH